MTRLLAAAATLVLAYVVLVARVPVTVKRGSFWRDALPVETV